MLVFLYFATVFIWGTTWIAIKYQLGDVDPIVSIAYRFLLSSLILYAYCKLRNIKLAFNVKEHAFMAIQGFFIYGLNFWLLYYAEFDVVSGLVSVVFSTIILMNIFNSFLILKEKIHYRVIFSALVGILGCVMIFYHEITSVKASNEIIFGIGLAFGGTLSASFGSVISARNQRAGLPVIQTNVFSMGYGALFSFLLVLLSGKEITINTSFEYMSSLIYLSIFGSIIAFGSYLTLVGRIGAGKAAYTTIVFPIIALGISVFVEGYSFTTSALIGIGLIIVGNLAIINKKNESNISKTKESSSQFEGHGVKVKSV